jgi:hypothetical protein
VEHHAYTLREVARAAGLKTVQQIAQQPGMKAVYRITVRYKDGRKRSSVATLRHSLGEDIVLEVVYQGLFKHKPLVHRIPIVRYEAFRSALHKAGFDRMRDQPDVPFHGVDLWLVERAAGSFVRTLILAPERADGTHAAVISGVQQYLPEALRQIE